MNRIYTKCPAPRFEKRFGTNTGIRKSPERRTVRAPLCKGSCQRCWLRGCHSPVFEAVVSAGGKLLQSSRHGKPCHPPLPKEGCFVFGNLYSSRHTSCATLLYWGRAELCLEIYIPPVTASRAPSFTGGFLPLLTAFIGQMTPIAYLQQLWYMIK